MWDEINDIVTKAGCKLSLYADDITISGSVVRKAMIWQVKQIVHRHGHRLKAKKEVSLINAPADITGVIVKGERTLLPNRQHKELARLKRDRSTATNPKLQRTLDNQIAGRKAQRKQVEGR